MTWGCHAYVFNLTMCYIFSRLIQWRCLVCVQSRTACLSRPPQSAGLSWKSCGHFVDCHHLEFYKSSNLCRDSWYHDESLRCDAKFHCEPYWMQDFTTDVRISGYRTFCRSAKNHSSLTSGSHYTAFCYLAVASFNMKFSLIVIFCRFPVKVVYWKQTFVTRKPCVKLNFTPVHKSHDTMMHRKIK